MKSITELPYVKQKPSVVQSWLLRDVLRSVERRLNLGVRDDRGSSVRRDKMWSKSQNLHGSEEGIWRRRLQTGSFDY